MILDNYTYIEKTERVKNLLHDTEMLMAANFYTRIQIGQKRCYG